MNLFCEICNWIGCDDLRCKKLIELEKFASLIFDKLQAKSYAEGFARGQEKKATCLCGPLGSCALHQDMFEQLQQKLSQRDAEIERLKIALGKARLDNGSLHT